MKKCKKLNHGLWDIHTLHDSDSAQERTKTLVSLELKKNTIDIADLSGTRLAGSSQLEEVEGGYVFFFGLVRA